ncbi:restriction endonuclease subunit S [Escherichia coli]|uniref:restriction endonuclease subunit S n=1 Tax=Escherichia coli TaxID=562 RepID=UPI00202BAEFD|nr:restriction endonuclease subunit S [Escherichia coli]
MESLALMPKYEAYKDSQVQWIGDIPANWHLEKAKWLFYKADRKPLVDDDIVTCFRDGQVTLRKNRRTEGFTNALKEHGYQRICKGDLVIHAMDAFAGAIGVSDSDGKSTPVYAACVPRKIGKVNSYYYAYYMRDLALSGFIVSLAKGIRERSTDFRFNDFAELLLPFPDYEEQTLIANFLDKKTALIDEAISIKEKQISLLKERKQIIIQQAVTQGLDPNVPMKDSGMDWIGKIPQHWKLKPNKCLFKLKKSLVGKRSGDYELLSLTLKGIIKRDMDNPEGKFPAEFNTYQEVSVGDFVFCLFDVEETPRTVGLSKFNGMITGAYTVFELDESVSKEFLYYFYLNLDSRKMMRPLYKGLRNTISKETFLSFKSFIPPLKEQEEIVDFIEYEVNKIDLTIDGISEQIDKIKEYKSCLINGSVTGKIKVTSEMAER